jgi:hypothetical protein
VSERTDESTADLSAVDHLVYACPDLETGIAQIERLTGVRAAPGGQHSGLGTHNALIALGSRRYLEIIAPDPHQPAPSGPRHFGIDDHRAPRLVTWAAVCPDIDAVRRRAAAVHELVGEERAGSRTRPDGVTLTWRMTSPVRGLGGGIVPFLIDWGRSPHPSESAPGGLVLRGLYGEHPEPERIRAALDVLGVKLALRPGDEPALVAMLDSPLGPVTLR